MKKYGTDTLDFAVKVEVKYMRRSVDIIKNLILYFMGGFYKRVMFCGKSAVSSTKTVLNADLTLCVGATPTQKLFHNNLIKFIINKITYV